MGLGKTISALALVASVSSSFPVPTLIVCPLSVISTWLEEAARTVPGLRVIVYRGSKEERKNFQEKEKRIKRIKIQEERIGNEENMENDASKERSKRIGGEERIKSSKRMSANNKQIVMSANSMEESEREWDILLTTYEMILQDSDFLLQLNIEICIIDEAHRLKNRQSMLFQVMQENRFPFYLLLTGTPYQNNVSEMFSLLQFVAPYDFVDEEKFHEKFGALSSFENKQFSSAVLELREILSKYMLRRLKSDVNIVLPEKKEIVLYVGLSEMQKKYYKAILTKNIGVLGSQNARGLIAVVMQLRKCCNHPYLFAGAEPEPFAEGDHIFQNAGKFAVLDKLLPQLRAERHRVLLFCTSVQTLDVVQDYLSYREFSYERLDGSVRGEERNARVSAFNQSSSVSNDAAFIFILSTRAGGVGLNLTSADTVIFLDSDFNPQMDLQAAARVHRIGQTKPVTIIRLVTKNSVEEIIFRRTLQKLRQTIQILDSGSEADDAKSLMDAVQLKESLTFGFTDVWDSSHSSIEDADIETILKGAVNISNFENATLEASNIAKIGKDNLSSVVDQGVSQSLYYYAGVDFKGISDQDKNRVLNSQLEIDDASRNIFDELVQSAVVSKEKIVDLSKRRAGIGLSAVEQLRHDESKKKRVEKKLKMDAKKEKERINRWKEAGYVSCRLQSADIDVDAALSDCDSASLTYVYGDATKPEVSNEKGAVILACVDNSGVWGTRGFFKSLSSLSSTIGNSYVLAGAMDDLHLGDAHLIDISTPSKLHFVALLVCQKRKKSEVSGILYDSFASAILSVREFALEKQLSVHCPRLGHGTANFNWYGIERLLKRYFLPQVETTVYYFKHCASNSVVTFPNSASNVTCAIIDNEVDITATSSPAVVLPGLVPIFVNDVMMIHPELKEREPELVYQLRRNVVAHGGAFVDLESSDDDSLLVRFVIIDSLTSNQAISDIHSAFSKLEVIHFNWIMESIVSGARVAIDKFKK